MKVTFRPLGREHHDVGHATSEEGSEPPPAGQQTIECTPGHAWLLADGTVIFASHLLPGHVLRDDHDQPLVVVDVEVERRQAATYNVEVPQWHTYYVSAGGPVSAWVQCQ